MNKKEKSGRNKTTVLNEDEKKIWAKNLITLSKKSTLKEVCNKTICQDIFQAVPYLPQQSVDLLIVDPPYNQMKDFNGLTYRAKSNEDYANWLDSWVSLLLPVLKKTASLYICGDWRSSAAIYQVATQYFNIHNRITWEREKGRGAKTNWKNCAEDIWFCSCSNDYYFDVDGVKLMRKVIAPYKDNKGKAKDWVATEKGNFRETYPSNLWTDISIPFWSMPENTEHPTQKPEKLIAKLILASSKKGDVVFDPFLGSGSTAVVAKKLQRQYIGIEIDEYFACVAEKRLHTANVDTAIQGYVGGYFWERNSQHLQQAFTKTDK